MEKIKFFDTTLRDGEQTPRVNFNTDDKVRIARQLENLGVDIIEAGFPIASDGDFEGVKAVAKTAKKSIVCGLARCKKEDIDKAYEALKYAIKPRIHVFLATSDIHLKYKLKITKEEAVSRAVEMVKYAKTLVDDVQFSAEDATRTDKEFLCEIFAKVIEAGASTINIPDTVGFVQPFEYYEFVSYISENTKGIENVTISVHCHDDLGLATANAMAGIKGGARQVECTVNGLGERAGNTAIEEASMILDTRKSYYGFKSDINTTEIYKTSKLINSLSAVSVSPNKSIIGENCFLHESGIHQDGILKNRATYEIMDPIKIGIPTSDGLLLGKHSGRHVFKAFFENNGFKLDEEKIRESFSKFKEMTDKNKYITTEEIISLVIDDDSIDNYRFISYESKLKKQGLTEISISISKGNIVLKDSAEGNGQVDAAYKAINKIIKKDIEILNYEINAISSRSDALGEAKIVMRLGDRQIKASGLDMDIIKASILAYIQGINKLGIN